MQINFIAKEKRKFSELYLTSLLLVLLALLAAAIGYLDAANRELGLEIGAAELSWQELSVDLDAEERHWRERQKSVERDAFLRAIEQETLRNQTLLDLLLSSVHDDPYGQIDVRSITFLEESAVELRGSCASVSELTAYQHALRERGFEDMALLAPIVRSGPQQNYSFAMSLGYRSAPELRGSER